MFAILTKYTQLTHISRSRKTDIVPITTCSLYITFVTPVTIGCSGNEWTG